MLEVTSRPGFGKKKRTTLHGSFLLIQFKVSKSYVLAETNQPHPPDPQDPELQPPPELIGLTEVMPNPDLGPAST